MSSDREEPGPVELSGITLAREWAQASFILGDNERVTERDCPLLGACVALGRILSPTWTLSIGKSELTWSRTPRNIWGNTCSACRIRQHGSQYHTSAGPGERWTELYRAARKSSLSNKNIQWSILLIMGWDRKKSCLTIYLILVTSNLVLYWTIAYWDKASGWRQARSFFWMPVR